LVFPALKKMPGKNRVRAPKSAKNQSTDYEPAETLGRGHVFRNQTSERGFGIFFKAKFSLATFFFKKKVASNDLSRITYY